MTILAIAIGGAVGSVLRYIMGEAVQRATAASFPVGTLAVNIVGCLIVGILGQVFMNAEPPSVVRGLLVVGFCGGFTTFSTFSFETVGLLYGGEYGKVAAYVILSASLCVLATLIGMVLVRTFSR